MPGRETTPVTDIELITGISALRSDKFPGYTLIALRVTSIPETIAALKANDIAITRGCATPVATSSSCVAASRA